MSDLTQPHDHLLKTILADPEAAGALLRERLPTDVAALRAPDPPERVDGTFIDDALREHLTDRLYRARLKDGAEAFIYTLLEHKSWPDRKTGWQLHETESEACGTLSLNDLTERESLHLHLPTGSPALDAPVDEAHLSTLRAMAHRAMERMEGGAVPGNA